MRSSSAGDTTKNNNKYTIDRLWLRPDYWFWETAMYSENAKAYFRDWVRQMQDKVDKKGVIR